MAPSYKSHHQLYPQKDRRNYDMRLTLRTPSAYSKSRLHAPYNNNSSEQQRHRSSSYSPPPMRTGERSHRDKVHPTWNKHTTFRRGPSTNEAYMPPDREARASSRYSNEANNKRFTEPRNYRRDGALQRSVSNPGPVQAVGFSTLRESQRQSLSGNQPPPVFSMMSEGRSDPVASDRILFPWVPILSSQGKTYYYHTETGISQWNKPS